MQTDPIADMLTRIRNAAAVAMPSVDVPASKFKKALAEILVREGYLKDVEEVEEGGKLVLRRDRRAYTKSKGVPVVRGGLGLAIISTPLGLLADREARAKNVGGEIICEVW
jgi:small subunit ribosomal protein S8